MMDVTTLATIGAGNIGTNVALAAISAGYDVVLSNSRGPESLSSVIKELGPMARAATMEEAAAAGDIVLVAIPLKSIGDIPVKPLAGKVVLDANNYYPERDGRIASLDANETTTSELLQAHLPDSHVVKAFNSIYAAQIPTDGGPKGAPGRRALPIAGDDADAKVTAAALIDDFGYDAVDLGPLSESWRVERDTLAYGQVTTSDELRDLAARTERVQQA
jgi:hypothetical protein